MRSIRIFALFLICISVFQYNNNFADPPKNTPLVTKELLKELEAFGSYMERFFPKNKFVIVSLGRSPTLITAYLHSGNACEVHTLPMSNAPKHLEANSPLLGEPLREHFRRFLPDPESLKGRRIILIDFHNTGDSLRAAHTLLQSYYPGAIEIIPIALIQERAKYNSSMDVLSLPNNIYKTILEDRFRVTHAQYGKANPSDLPLRKLSSAGYEALVNELTRERKKRPILRRVKYVSDRACRLLMRLLR